MDVIRSEVFLVVLLALGVLTRVVGLGYPDQVVFDEVHFGKFVNSYCCTGEHFFDIHPPHGKLLVAGVAKLAGYDGSQPFETIGEPYGAGVPVAALRLVPALAGALLPLVLFMLLRQLGVSPAVAFLGGWLTVLDNALVVQSRLISLDSVLLLATFGSVSAYLYGVSRLSFPYEGKVAPADAGDGRVYKTLSLKNHPASALAEAPLLRKEGKG